MDSSSYLCVEIHLTSMVESAEIFIRAKDAGKGSTGCAQNTQYGKVVKMERAMIESTGTQLLNRGQCSSILARRPEEGAGATVLASLTVSVTRGNGYQHIAHQFKPMSVYVKIT